MLSDTVQVKLQGKAILSSVYLLICTDLDRCQRTDSYRAASLRKILTWAFKTVQNHGNSNKSSLFLQNVNVPLSQINESFIELYLASK